MPLPRSRSGIPVRRRATASPSVAGGLAVACVLLVPSFAPAQITGEVEVRDGYGRALVRNASMGDVDVELALWDSDETGRAVELLRPASANLWPNRFRLSPGETQTVRITIPSDAYVAGTLLRLESRFTPAGPPERDGAAEGQPPAEGEAGTGRGARARVVMVTRILSKVWVR